MTIRPSYVTKEGLEKLNEELTHLKTVKRREVSERISKAKDLGDISENADYADAKEEMMFMEGKIMELTDAIDRAVIIEHEKSSIIQIGSTIVIKNGGAEKNYTIVGASEADPMAGRISNETPLAQALLGKKVGDKINVKVPAGVVTYAVLRVE